MEELLILILQLLIESIAYCPWDALLYSREKSGRDPSVITWSSFSLIMGGVLGAGSLLLLPDVLLKWHSLRIITLVGLPVLSGAIAGRMATKRTLTRDTVDVRTHFWGAAMFTLGVVVVRFAFANR